MKKFYMQFRIGEKIAFSFGIVGLLFLGVIWQYHQTLQGSLSDYQALQEGFAAKQGHALLIENYMLQARRAERDFLLQRGPEYAASVNDALHQALVQADALARVDEDGAASRTRIHELVTDYRQRFEAVVEAWRFRGLDHNSGLQGAFRDTAHRVQERARHFKVGGLYRTLLQIFRNERDLGLNRQAEYRDRVLGLLGAFELRIETLGLRNGLEQTLLKEVRAYREGFLSYADSILRDADGAGDREAFQPAARRIEALLKSYMIPDLPELILEVRRREKDYLLRGDHSYVDLVINELRDIQEQVKNSSVSKQNKASLVGLLDDYRRDFLSLVEQDIKIARLQDDMRRAVAEVARLMRGNVQTAEREMRESSAAIHASSSANARNMLWMAGLATLLGIASVVLHPQRGSPPATYGRLVGRGGLRGATDPNRCNPGGRDEVNVMAQTVNAMADHKVRFIDWWKTSMRDAEACERASAQPESPEAEDEVLQARRAKQKVSDKLHEEIRGLIQDCRVPEGVHRDPKQVDEAAKSALAILDVLRGGERRRDSD